jgi:hypothetical protein
MKSIYAPRLIHGAGFFHGGKWVSLKAVLFVLIVGRIGTSPNIIPYLKNKGRNPVHAPNVDPTLFPIRKN